MNRSDGREDPAVFLNGDLRGLHLHNPALTTTIVAMPNACAASPFTRWSSKATACRSNPRPEREVGANGHFLSKARSQPLTQDRVRTAAAREPTAGRSGSRLSAV